MEEPATRGGPLTRDEPIQPCERQRALAHFGIVVAKTRDKIIFQRYTFTEVRYRPMTGKLGSVQLVYDPYNWDIRAVTLKELLELREGY